MNILITVTNVTAANGGVTTHIIDLCRELANRSINVILLSDKNSCDCYQKIADLENSSYFRFIHCAMEGFQSNPKRFTSVVNQVCKIIKENSIDLLHTHSQSFCVVGALVKLKTGVPYIWTNHIDEIANPRLFKKIVRVLHFPIISVSTDLKKILTENYGVKDGRITVVNNGVNPERFPPLTIQESSVLKQKFECGDKYVIGLLARMSFGKGHIYLLEAVNKLQKENGISNIKVCIAGKLHEGERKYFEKLQKYCEDNQIDMSFLGFQNPRDVFGICDISTLPSIYEGFGLTVIESLMMACPVIRSNTPGWMDTRDIALTFQKRDVDELAKHLLFAYTHPHEMRDMANKGKNIVLSKFTITNQVDQTIAVYKRYMRGKK